MKGEQMGWDGMIKVMFMVSNDLKGDTSYGKDSWLPISRKIHGPNNCII